VVLKLADGAAMAPPPLVAVRRVWFTWLVFLSVFEFARSFSFRRIKRGLEWWSRWGEPPSPAMEGPPAMGCCRPDLVMEAGLFTVELQVIVSRPFLNQRPRLEDTPSRGNLSKETLSFLVIKPRSVA
jgi:hypothetical protein